jgi:formate hydrogenlyase subunit 3/multisubunit Na+/H+ antiporter MnhD subunit
MSETVHAVFLWLAVAWPLLLAIPALQSRVPWSRHLAIVPAVVLMVLPGETSLGFPWFIFGTGLAVDGDIRWILAMSITVWLAAATALSPGQQTRAQGRTIPFFMLTLAGNLGAVLAADLVTFFSFSTLMGYSLYGLLIGEGDEAARRAARLYVIVLIIADLALFEALLLAAAVTEELGFETVRRAMADTTASPSYLWMALAGFALRAGIWPLHRWLTGSFRAAPRSAVLLLGGVPVAMGLLGAVRWLPLGETASQGPGSLIQVIGVAAMLYAAARALSWPRVTLLPAWIALGATGLFVVHLGRGLVNPDTWLHYEHLSYPFIAFLGVFITALTWMSRWLIHEHDRPAPVSGTVQTWLSRLEPWPGRLQQTITGRFAGLRSSCRRLQRVEPFLSTSKWQQLLDDGERGIQRWGLTITVLVIIGIVVTLFGLA